MRFKVAAARSGEKADEIAVLCSATFPHSVVWASKSWLRLCGFDSINEILGRSLSCIQGPGTDSLAIQKLIQAMKASRPCKLRLVNYHRVGHVPFLHTVSVCPLHSADGDVKLFRATSTEVQWLCPQPASTIEGSHAVGTSFTTHSCASIASHGDGSCSSAVDVSSSVDASNDSHYFGAPMKVPVPSIFGGMPVTVITHAQPPYSALWASPAWLQLCGLAPSELAGQTLSVIQGPGTSREAIGELMSAAKENRPCSGIQLVNYHKSGAPFKHTVSIERMMTPGGLHILRATSTNVSRLGAKYIAGDEMDGSSCLQDEPAVWGDEFEAYQAHWDRLADEVIQISPAVC